jgi:hypothetical protein
MRKHKSVVAILLAVMMIFTFMPTMAFATPGEGEAVDGQWRYNYTEVSVDGENWYTADRNFTETGVIMASISTKGKSAATIATLPNVKPAYFYDFTNATLADDQGYALLSRYQKSEFASYNSTYSLFDSYYEKNARIKSLILKVPAYVDNYDSISDTVKKNGVVAYNGDVEIVGNILAGWSFDVKYPSNYDPTSVDDQKFTLAAILTSQKADGSYENPDRIDTSAVTKEVVVAGTPKTWTTIKFYKDSAKAANQLYLPEEGGDVTVKFYYNGSDHSVINDTDTGKYTVAYSVLNESTGKYEPATACPTVTNVGDTKKVKVAITHVETKTTATSTSTTTVTDVTWFLNLSVEAPYDDVYFGFIKDGNGGDFAYNVTQGTEYNPVDYVVADYSYWRRGMGPSASYTWRGETPYGGEADTLAREAITANSALLMDLFNDFYEVKSSAPAADPNTVTLTIKNNTDKYATMTAAEKKAFKEKYGVMFRNLFGINAGAIDSWTYYFNVANGTATVKLVGTPDTKEDDITFLTVPNKTIKVKKAKKTKKAVSFAVEASAKSGKALTYQLTTPNKKIVIDPATGVITVKKGVKKGTYKVTVKATTNDGGGYKAAKESANLTIKVKK